MLLIRKRSPVAKLIKKTDISALVVCLGNPGRKYQRSRHNAGFMVGDVLEERFEVLKRAANRQQSLTLLKENGISFAVLRPLLYMNNSGIPTAKIVKRLSISIERLIVVHDDIDIPLGKVRLKKGSGTAGHRGLESIVQSLGTREFHRVRVGVGRPPEGVDPVDHVLGEFESEEWEVLRVSLYAAADLVIGLVRELAQKQNAG